MHATPVARVLRINAAAAVAVLPAVDGQRRRPQASARPQQGGRHAVHCQRVLGPGVVWQERAHAERPQASPHLARSHISGTNHSKRQTVSVCNVYLTIVMLSLCSSCGVWAPSGPESFL